MVVPVPTSTQERMVYNVKSHLQMDDDWGYQAGHRPSSSSFPSALRSCSSRPGNLIGGVKNHEDIVFFGGLNEI